MWKRLRSGDAFRKSNLRTAKWLKYYKKSLETGVIFGGEGHLEVDS